MYISVGSVWVDKTGKVALSLLDAPQGLVPSAGVQDERREGSGLVTLEGLEQQQETERG